MGNFHEDAVVKILTTTLVLTSLAGCANNPPPVLLVCPGNLTHFPAVSPPAMRPHVSSGKEVDETGMASELRLRPEVKAGNQDVSEQYLFVCCNACRESRDSRWKVVAQAASQVLAAAEGRGEHTPRQQAVLFLAHKLAAEAQWFVTADNIETLVRISAFPFKQAKGDAGPYPFDGNMTMSAIIWRQSSEQRVKHLQEAIRLGQSSELWTYLETQSDLPIRVDYFRGVAKDASVDLLNLQREMALNEMACDPKPLGRLPALAHLEADSLCHLADLDRQRRYPKVKK